MPNIDEAKLQQALAAAGAAARIAGMAGVPYAGLVATLEPAIAQLVGEIAARTGKTRDQILDEMQIGADRELTALLLDEAEQSS